MTWKATGKPLVVDETADSDPGEAEPMLSPEDQIRFLDEFEALVDNNKGQPSAG